MRAGLLSNPRVIKLLNEKFVSMWIRLDEAHRLAKQGNALAKTLADNWEYPLEFVFLSPDGRLVTKLNSFKDLRAAHPDVGHPRRGGPSHVNVFLNRVAVHFGED